MQISYYCPAVLKEMLERDLFANATDDSLQKEGWEPIGSGCSSKVYKHPKLAIALKFEEEEQNHGDFPEEFDNQLLIDEILRKEGLESLIATPYARITTKEKRSMIFMEYVRGTPAGRSQAVHVADALLRRLGIINDDLCYPNALITSSNRVVILDWDTNVYINVKEAA